MKNKKYIFDKIFSLACVSVSIFLLALSKTVSGFANACARYVLPVFTNTIGRAMSIFPFSVFELFIYTAAAFIVFFAVYVFLNLKKKNREKVISFLWKNACLVCALFLMMTMTTAVNFGRDSVSDFFAMDEEKYTKEELFSLARIIVQRANALSDEVHEDYGRSELKRDGVIDECISAMQNLGEKYDGFSGYYARPKTFLFSKGMSYLNITGIFSPFTLEPNYSSDVVDFLIPFTVCHELAHSRGFMREEDANFIAYLAARDSGSPAVRLSAETNALIYTLNACATAGDARAYSEIYYSIDERILSEFNKNAEHWQEYDTPVAQVASKANDIYLKANAQKEGVNSYGKMVDLVFALYKDEIKTI